MIKLYGNIPLLKNNYHNLNDYVILRILTTIGSDDQGPCLHVQVQIMPPIYLHIFEANDIFSYWNYERNHKSNILENKEPLFYIFF